MPPVNAVSRWLGKAALYLDSTVYRRGKHHNGLWNHKLRPVRHVPRVMLDTCMQGTLWIGDNDESDSVTAALWISLSSRFYCIPRSTTAVLNLISVFVYPLLRTSSNRCITFTQMLSDCSIRLINLFQLDWMTCIMCKNPSVRYWYRRQKVFSLELQQKFWPSDWESLLMCTCWIRKSDALALSPFVHRTPNFIHLHARSECLCIRNFITIGQRLLGTVFLLLLLL